MEIEGIVVSGTHKGSYFMSLEVYQEQFQSKLGFKPYAGTLNLKITPAETEKIERLKEKMGIIEGSGQYGDVKFIHAMINGIAGALLFPVKSQHSPETLEFVAPYNLRKTLKLEDGSHVKLIIE